jgi:hypothetical protein
MAENAAKSLIFRASSAYSQACGGMVRGFIQWRPKVSSPAADTPD